MSRKQKRDGLPMTLSTDDLGVIREHDPATIRKAQIEVVRRFGHDSKEILDMLGIGGSNG